MREATWRAGLGEFSDCLLAGLLVAVASVPVVTAAPALVAGCRAVDRSRRGVGGPLWTTFWADFRSVVRGGVLFGVGCVVAVVVFAVDLEVAGSLPGAGLVRPVLGVLAGAAVVAAARTCEVVATRGPGLGAVSPSVGVAVAAGHPGVAAAGEPGVVSLAAGAARRPGAAAAGGPGEQAAGGAAGMAGAMGRPSAGSSGAATPWRRATLAAARETVASPGSAALLAAAVGLSAVLVWMLPILAFIVAGPLCLAAVATGGRS
ncbi:DUF624 domain-containing protein [Amycolatopsis eburnea]|uniref:DUF624 domain-containing protein n=1 Tax=Amycolatopsis eburnea TaxID=2267691 RepID=A0A427SYB7_9PSEU|nr:DUF624 domain-containing protein [Amycolatopsis eburnea]RSD09535.1 DUF624 domain-containing protein [Amycolatopsis eburnea]